MKSKLNVLSVRMYWFIRIYLWKTNGSGCIVLPWFAGDAILPFLLLVSLGE